MTLFLLCIAKDSCICIHTYALNAWYEILSAHIFLPQHYLDAGVLIALCYLKLKSKSTHWKLVHLQWSSFLLIRLDNLIPCWGKISCRIYLVKGLYVLAFLEFWHNLFVDTLVFVSKGKIFFYCLKLPCFYIFKNIRYLHSFSSKSIKSYLIV